MAYGKLHLEQAPPCFEPIKWREWNNTAVVANPGQSSYCNDCLPEFQTEMRLCGKCAHPEVQFTREEDGSEYLRDGPKGLIGVRPEHTKMSKHWARRPIDPEKPKLGRPTSVPVEPTDGGAEDHPVEAGKQESLGDMAFLRVHFSPRMSAIREDWEP